MLHSKFPRRIVDGYPEKYLNFDKNSLANEPAIKQNKYGKYPINGFIQSRWDKHLKQQQESGASFKLKAPELKSINQYIRLFYRQSFNIITIFDFVEPKNLIIYHSWYEFQKSYYSELLKRREVLLPSYFEKFCTEVIEAFQDIYKSESKYTLAFKRFVEFITFINNNYLQKPYYYALPQISKCRKHNEQSIDDNWVARGKVFNRVKNLVVAHWKENGSYSEEQIIASLIFSGITYGGINNKDWLLPWLSQCLDNKLSPFIGFTLQTQVRYKHKRYGNERIEKGYEDGTKKSSDSNLYNNHQIVIDRVSQCWLVHYYNLPSNKRDLVRPTTLQEVESLLTKYLKLILDPYNIAVPKLSELLSIADYNWTILPGVNIDQALAGVLKGSIKTTGMIEDTFEHLMSFEYNLTSQPYTSIESSIPDSQSHHIHNGLSNLGYRKSDIVSLLQGLLKEDLPRKNRFPIFKVLTSDNSYNNLSRVPRQSLVLMNWFMYGIKKEITAQLKSDRPLYERVLVRWVVELLKPPRSRKLKTISDYLGKIGNEWCYFMIGQPTLEAWDNEDFIDFYNDLLEFKSIAQNNKAIDQPAKLLQRLHTVGVEFYGFPDVKIEQAQTRTKVRAEWVSVQSYYAILEQIHLSAKAFEKDMWMLVIILTYRCGFRKKELLGIQIKDIEGMRNQPSVVIRPNTYRPLKTASSKRRVPVYALLTEDERAVFIRYVESKRGQGVNTYLFSNMSAKYPIASDLPLKLLKDMMGYIGESRSYTFHGLRHTAVTNLAIVNSARGELVEALTGYSEQDIARVLTGLNGVHHDGADKWQAIARVVGHLSPQRSFEYYFHAAALVATYELANADIKLPASTFLNITGVKRSSLRGFGLIVDETVSLQHAAPWLFRQVTQPTQQYRKPVTHNIMLAAFDDDTKSKVFGATVSDSLLARYGVNQVLAMLTAIKQKMATISKEEAIEAGSGQAAIAPEDAKRLYERAKAMSAIRTTVKKKESYRFVKEEDHLMPMRIHEYIEHELMALMYKELLELREACWADYEWYLNTVAQRITSTHANISFPLKELDELKRFINITFKLLSSKHLLVTANKVLVSKLSSREGMQGVKTVCDDTVSTYLVGVCIPNSVKDATKKWKYSSILRFTVHMFLIMDEEVSLSS